MAKIEEITVPNSKEEALKLEKAKKLNAKKGLSEEEKRKYIAYGILGLISLGGIFYALKDFGANNKEKQVTELSTPESESDKYNSKIEAVQKGEKPSNERNNTLMDAYTTKNETSTNNDIDKKAEITQTDENEQVAKFEEQIRKHNQKVAEKSNTENNTNSVTSSRTSQKRISSKKTSYTTPTNNYQNSTLPQKENNRQITNSNASSPFGDFFSSSKNDDLGSSQIESDPYFYAVIKGDHLGLRNKQRVALMLPKDAMIMGKIYKKNTVIYAIATFAPSRVKLTITNINQVPLNIQAYDAEDGALGLQVRESLVSETSTEMVSEGADDTDLSNVPFGNTIKKILKKKNKEPKVDLLNNQKMVLKIGR